MKRSAFTLVELLVVIAIVGLLSSVAVVSLSSARAKARDTKRIADLRQISKALAVYANENGAYPTTAMACLGKNDGATCWNGIVSGSTSLNSALAPYMANVPADPQSSRALGDSYVYLSAAGVVTWHCIGTFNPTGPFLLWYPDKGQPGAQIDADCLGMGYSACCGTVGCTAGYYCAQKLGE